MYRHHDPREQARLEAVEEQLSEAYRNLSGLHEQGEPTHEWLEKRAAALARATRLFHEQVKRAAAREAAPKRRREPLAVILLASSLSLGVLASGLALAHRHSPASAQPPVAAVPVAPAQPAPATDPLPAEPPQPEAIPEAPEAPVATPDNGFSAADYERFLSLSRAFFRAVRNRDGAAMARVSHPVFGLRVLNPSAGSDRSDATLAPAEERACFHPSTTAEVDPCGGRAFPCAEGLEPFASLPFEKATSVTFNEADAAIASDDWRAFTTFTLTNPTAAPGLTHEVVALRFEKYEERWWISTAVRLTR